MTGTTSLAQRHALARTLRAQRDAAAEQITQEFLGRHPDWVETYGELAWVRGLEDARFHVDFLAGAIESGSPAAFADYARWTARVLGARGIGTEFLVENLEQLRNWLDGVLTAPDRDLVRACVTAACNGLNADAAPAAGDAPADALALERSTYLRAVLDGQRQAAVTIATEALDRGIPLTDLYCDLLQPTQYEVGRLWERNEITVAREHMATAITQFVVAQLYARVAPPTAHRGRMIVTGVEGELHQLGANMLADVLEADGWDVRFLGTQLPHRDVLSALDEHRPAVLAVSATMLFNLPKVTDLVAEARRQFGRDLRIVVGGGAFRCAPDVWSDIGADGFGRDLREGIALVNRLLPVGAG